MKMDGKPLFTCKMEEIRRRKRKNTKFCAKCADVEKTPTKLCMMHIFRDKENADKSGTVLA